MLIPKVNRNEVYKALFSEGVIWAKKDYNLPKHPEVGQSGENPIDVPNLQVIKLMQSFKSKGFVNEIFSWRHYYWYLTDEGIEYLREYLNLSADVVPNTLNAPNTFGGAGHVGIVLHACACVCAAFVH